MEMSKIDNLIARLSSFSAKWKMTGKRNLIIFPFVAYDLYFFHLLNSSINLIDHY